MGDFEILTSEIVMTLLALLGQSICLFYKRATVAIIYAVLIISSVVLVIAFDCFENTCVGFYDSIFIDSKVHLFKIIIFIFAALSILLYKSHCKLLKVEVHIEFVTLVLLSTVATFISISLRNFLLLFCALELQALIGYALVAFDTSNAVSSEGALKYLIIGAVITCVSLFGISFIYGFNGSLSFVRLQTFDAMSIMCIIGFLLFLSNIIFKLSAVPFHFWALDVYESAPLFSTAYISTVQKLGILIVFFNIVSNVMDISSSLTFSVLLKGIAILSMIIGSLGAIYQTSIMRMLAYSGVLNAGYVLMGFVVHGDNLIPASLFYMIIYSASVFCIISLLIALVGGVNAYKITLQSISGIGYTRKSIAAGLTILLFSMIGLPPLAGFFGKYYLFYNTILEGELSLGIIGIIASAISAVYYLKIVKSMYFSDTIAEVNYLPTNKTLLLITSLIIFFTIFFGIFVSRLWSIVSVFAMA